MTLLKEIFQINENRQQDDQGFEMSDLHIKADKLNTILTDSGNTEAEAAYDKFMGGFQDLDENPINWSDADHTKYIKGAEKIIKMYNLK